MWESFRMALPYLILGGSIPIILLFLVGWLIGWLHEGKAPFPWGKEKTSAGRTRRPKRRRKRMTPREEELERRYRELQGIVEAQMQDNYEAMETFRKMNEAAHKFDSRKKQT